MSLSIKENSILAAHTTLHVGGVADYFCEVTSRDELEQALRFAQQNATPLLVLGGGSNVLFLDEGYRGLVIKNVISGLTITEQENEVLITVGAGENWDDFVSSMCEREYWGIENLSAIPGTVGATPIQNVGAYGVEVSDVITHVFAMHVDTCEVKQFTHAECQFAYRDSFFKTAEGKQWVVTSVTFRLSKNSKANLGYADLHPLLAQETLTANEVRDFVMTVRAAKFPDWSQVGTAGSFFKNPIIPESQYFKLKEKYPALPAHQTQSGDWKLSLGWVLDKVCGLKGYCVDAVCLFEKQALVLTNSGTSAENIYRFVELVTKSVFEKTGIKIEPEVLLVKNKID